MAWSATCASAACRGRPTLAVYLPAYGAGQDHMFFAIHTTAPTETLVPMLRTALAGIDPELPLASVRTVEDIVSASTASRRIIVILLSVFAALALTLALVGIYGVTSYAVSRQTAEIGVRLALGAGRDHVFRFIIIQGMKPVVAGIAVGGVAAVLLSRFIANLLFGVTARDPLTYIGVAALLIAAALLACIVPARQATRIDVLSALRAD